MTLSVKTKRVRHLRRRDPHKQGSRLKRYLAWIADVAADLAGTGTSQTFTADVANNEIDVSSHGLSSGDGPFSTTSVTTLPAGLSDSTLYWVNAVTAGTLSLHLTRKEAILGENPVSITDAGTGVHSITPATTEAAMTEHLRQGVDPYALNSETDVDNI
jgi:hypothetical protein